MMWGVLLMDSFFGSTQRDMTMKNMIRLKF